MLKTIDLRGAVLDARSLRGVLPRAELDVEAALDVVGPICDDVARRGADGALQRVDLQVLPSAEEARAAHREGVIALLDRDLGADLSSVLNALPNPTKLAVAASPYGTSRAMLADASRAAWSAKVPRPLTATRVPGASVAPGPAAATTPAPSIPATKGKGGVSW